MKARYYNDYLKEKMKDKEFRELFQQEYKKLMIGFKIAQLRQKEGLSQRQLAKKIHTSQQAISRLESGTYRGYTISILEKIALVLGRTLDIKFRRV